MASIVKKSNGKQKTSQTDKPVKPFQEKLIRFITIIIIPIVLVLLIEILLRLVGYGTSPKYVFKEKVKGELCYVPNDDFTQKYFGRDMGRTTAAFAIPVHKKPNTCRIFLLGSSAAKGDPASAYSMSQILKVMLKEKYPDVNFEVINVGMTAINSHVIYQVAKECSKLDPDMFIVYAGNNEVVGPFGPGTVFSPLLSNIHMIRLLAGMKATRIGQFYSGLLSSIGSRPKEWGGMEMFLEKKVYLNDPRLQLVYKHFEHNLNDICKLAENKNIPIIVSSVGVNLKDCAPFEGNPANLSSFDNQKLEEYTRLGQKLESMGSFQNAIDQYNNVLQIDSSNANIWFEIADCYDQMAEFSKAKECYVKSMNLDALRFRADSRINMIIKKIALNKEDKNIYYADSEDTLIAYSQHNIPGDDLFYDHVHLRFKGNYLVAKTLLNEIAKSTFGRNHTSNGSLPDLTNCEKKLGFTGWDSYKLCQDMISRYFRPPFTNQINHTITSKLQNDELKQEEMYTKPASFPETQAAYEYSIQYDPANWMVYLRYTDFLQQAALNYEKAENLLLKVNELINHPSIIAELGNVAVKEGKYEKAIRYYKKAVDQIPGSAAALGNLALGYYLSGNYEKALTYYQKALKLSPELKNVHFGIANVYFKQGKYVDALNECKKEIKVNTFYPQVYEQLGNIFIKMDSLKKAELAYQLAFQLDPYNIDLNKERAEVLTKLGRYEESVVHYKYIALKTDTSAQAFIDCGNAISRTGNFKDANYFYSRAVRIDPKNYATYNNMGNVYLQLEKFDSSIYYYKKALSLKHDMPALHVNLGTAYLSKEDYNNALKSFNDALLIDSNFYAALISKGSVFEMRSEPALAEPEYRKAIKAEPNNGIGYKKLGLLLIGSDDYKESIEMSNKAHDLLPNDHEINDIQSLAYFKYGNYLFNQQQYPEAISNFEKAVQYSPKNQNPKVALGWAYYKQAQFEVSQHNPAETMRLLENAVKVFPEFIEANYNLAVMLIEQNRAEEAYKYIKQVYNSKPDYYQTTAIYNDLKKKYN